MSRRSPARGASARAAVLAVLLASVVGAEARVFWRSGGGPLGGGGSDPAWRTAYRADVRIDGGKAALTVWGASLDYGAAVDQLRARAERAGTAIVLESPDMTWGVVESDDRVVRFLAVRHEGGQTIVYEIAQSRGEYEASRAPPSYRFGPAPAPADAEPGTSVANETTGLATQGLRSTMPPEEVRRHYAEALVAAGWTALPLQLGGTSGPDVYARGQEYVFVYAKSSGGGGGTAAMLAHKRRVRGSLDAAR